MKLFCRDIETDVSKNVRVHVLLGSHIYSPSINQFCSSVFMIADKWQTLCTSQNGYEITLEWIIAMEKWQTSWETNLRICLNMSFLFGKRGPISAWCICNQGQWKGYAISYPFEISLSFKCYVPKKPSEEDQW